MVCMVQVHTVFRRPPKTLSNSGCCVSSCLFDWVDVEVVTVDGAFVFVRLTI